MIDAKKHRVEVRPIDVNYSLWDNLLEEKSGKYCAIRLGFRQVKGLRKDDINVLLSGRKKAYAGIHELLDSGLSKAALEKLADADAFRSIGLDRRAALWEVSAAADQSIGFFASQKTMEEKVALPQMTTAEHVVHDYAATSLSLKAHPVSFVREKLELLRIVSTNQLVLIQEGSMVKVAGLVLVRQRPGTAKGVCFITIEDETGVANLVVFEKLFDKYRKEILQARLLMVEGILQREGEVIHVIARRFYDLSKLLRHLTTSKNEDLPLLTLSRADEKVAPVPSYPGHHKIKESPKATQEEIFPKGRNFK